MSRQNEAPLPAAAWRTLRRPSPRCFRSPPHSLLATANPSSSSAPTLQPLPSCCWGVEDRWAPQASSVAGPGRGRRQGPNRGADVGGDDDVRCEACGSGEADEELMLCDGCDRGFHIFCLRPVLPRVPTGDWYCLSYRAPSAFSKSESSAAAHTVVAKKLKQFPLVQTNEFWMFGLDLDCSLGGLD